MATVTAERGYSATRVADVLDRTGISSRTFYAHFANREACFFAAYETIVDDLSARLRTQCGGSASQRIEASLRMVLEYFADWPAHAQVLLVEVLSAGPSGIERHEETMAMASARLAACRPPQPGPCNSLDRQEVAQAMIGAITRMVQLRLSSGEAHSLVALVPSMTALTTRVALAA